MTTVVLSKEVAARSGMYETFLRVLTCLNRNVEIRPWQQKWLRKLAEMLDDPTDPDLIAIRTACAYNPRFDLPRLQRNARQLAEGEAVSLEDGKALEVFVRWMFESATAAYGKVGQLDDTEDFTSQET